MSTEKEIAKKGDFVELKYTGYANGNIFDSNIKEDLNKINEKAEPKETIIVVGERMVVPGLDKAIEGKEIGKEYEIEVKYKEGFGERRKELVKTIPLKIFTQKNINPYPGAVLAMDDALAKVIAVSGARVLTDFNNPLAGKDLKYKFTIARKVTDDKERAKALFGAILGFVPEFEVNDKVIVKGPKEYEVFVSAFKDRFKEMIGKELVFEEKKESKEDKKEKAKKKNPKHGEEGHRHEEGESAGEQAE